METVIIILAITLLISSISIVLILKKYIDLIKKLNNSTIEKKAIEKIIDVEPGDNGVISEYPLSYKDDSSGVIVEKNFNVTYEVEILEVTKDKLKVSAKDFTSFDSLGKDPASKKDIINILQNIWIDKDRVDVIMDIKKIRNIKLNELGI